VSEVDGRLDIGMPSFRATKDITIEADVVRDRPFGRYDSIEPALPEVTVAMPS
jgi:hypothetical protein